MSDDVTKKTMPHPAFRRLPQWFENGIQADAVLEAIKRLKASGTEVDGVVEASHDEPDPETGITTTVIDEVRLLGVSVVPKREVGPAAQQEQKPL